MSADPIEVLEVSASGGGTYQLLRVPGGYGYRDAARDSYRIVHLGCERAARYRGGCCGAIVMALGAVIPAALVAKDSYAHAGLFVAVWLCFGSICGIAGWVLGYCGAAVSPPQAKIVFDHPLARKSVPSIQSNVEKRSVMVVTDRTRTRLVLESPGDAVTLADALQRALIAS